MAQEVRELIKNRELNLYVSLDRLSHVPNQFKVDRLQIIVVAKKYISTCRSCSSVGCLK